MADLNSQVDKSFQTITRELKSSSVDLDTSLRALTRSVEESSISVLSTILVAGVTGSIVHASWSFMLEHHFDMVLHITLLCFLGALPFALSYIDLRRIMQKLVGTPDSDGHIDPPATQEEDRRGAAAEEPKPCGPFVKPILVYIL